MPLNSARIFRLEDRLFSGLPLHKPLDQWPERALAKLEDPAVLALLSDDTLARLIAEGEVMEGGDAAALSEPITATTVAGKNGAHGYEPLALVCGCGSCQHWRHDNGVAEPAEHAEAARMSARLREVTNARRATLGLAPLPIPNKRER